MTYMKQVGIRDLQQHASQWVRRARAGETIEVTDRGVAVAILAPPRRGIEGLVASGLASPAEAPGGLAAIPEPIAPSDCGPTLSEILQELRADER